MILMIGWMIHSQEHMCSGLSSTQVDQACYFWPYDEIGVQVRVRSTTLSTNSTTRTKGSTLICNLFNHINYINLWIFLLLHISVRLSSRRTQHYLQHYTSQSLNHSTMRLSTTILSALASAILPSLTTACLGTDGLFLANADCTFTLYVFVDDNTASTVSPPRHNPR